MTLTAELGAGAPNFDLASTEGVVIMLRDEVPRSGVVLYLFSGDADEQVEKDLLALEAKRASIASSSSRILALSNLELDALAGLQARLGLGYPLLHDDREFLIAYGVSEQGGNRALFLVGHDETIRWTARPLDTVESAIDGLLAALAALPRSTANYPKSILNWLIDRLRG